MPPRRKLAVHVALAALAGAEVVLAALAVPAREARADEGPAGEARADASPVRVDYEAHEGCPGEGAFLDELTARTSRARAAAPGERALDVRVRITKRGEGSRGRITLGGPSPVAREVDGATCQEVVAALALITALKIDPEASLAPSARSPDAPGPPGEGAPEPPPEPPNEGAPPVKAPAPSAPAAIRAPATRPPARSAPGPAEPPPAKLRSTLGLHASAAFGVAPDVLLGGGPFVEVESNAGLGASFRFAVEGAATGTIDLGPGGARFTRGIARLDACPVLVRAAAWLTLAPCLGAEGGFLRGEGLPGPVIVDVKRATVPWASLGLLGRVAVDLGGIVRVDAQGGPQFPLVRRSFIFESPALVIHEVPAATWMLHLGAGPTFW